MPVDTEQPFCVRFDELRRDEGLTFRALASKLSENAAPGERPVSHGYLVNLVAGRRRPTPAIIDLVCRTFDDLEHKSFVEWRLWEIQSLFDPDGPAGLEAAVAAMRAYETGGGGRSSSSPDGARVRRRSRRVAAA